MIGVDRVAERLQVAQAHGIDTLDLGETDVVAEIRDRTDGRGADASLDAVGMEAHGSPALGAAISAVGHVPDALAKPMIKLAGLDRLAALTSAISATRRGGVVSVSGVYGGMVDPLPMMELFDKGLTLRMGQCNVKRWIADLMPLVLDETDPFGLSGLATHRLTLSEAAEGYRIFDAKSEGCLKVVLNQ